MNQSNLIKKTVEFKDIKEIENNKDKQIKINNEKKDTLNKIKNSININHKPLLIKSKTIAKIKLNYMKGNNSFNTHLVRFNLNENNEFKKLNSHETNKSLNIRKKIREPKIEELYKFAQKNFTKLRNKNVREKVEKYLEHKKNIYNNKKIGNYYHYLKNLSDKLNHFDIKESMRRVYNLTGRKMVEERRNKIELVENLENEIKDKEKELIYSILIKRVKKNVSSNRLSEDKK